MFYMELHEPIYRWHIESIVLLLFLEFFNKYREKWLSAFSGDYSNNDTCTICLL